MSRRQWLAAIAAAIISFLALSLWMKYGELWAVDGCLDSGGAWNYQEKECRH